METASHNKKLRYRDWYLDIPKGGYRSKRAELMGTSSQANRVAQPGVKGQPSQPMLPGRQRRRHLMPCKGSPEEGNHRSWMPRKSPVLMPSIWLRVSAPTWLLTKETPTWPTPCRAPSKETGASRWYKPRCKHLNRPSRQYQWPHWINSA